MIAYTLLVGALYWADEMGRSQAVVAFAMIAVQGPRDPASRRASRAGVALSPAFDAWFARATAVDPAARFPTAGAAVAALVEALGVGSPSTGAPRRASTAPPSGSARALGLGTGSIAGTSREHAILTGRRVPAGVAWLAAIGVVLIGGWIYVRATRSQHELSAPTVTALEDEPLPLPSKIPDPVEPAPAAPLPSAARPAQSAARPARSAAGADASATPRAVGPLLYGQD